MRFPIAGLAVLLAVGLVALIAGAQRPDGPPGPPPGGPGPGGPMRMPVLAALDADGDGQMSAEEIEGAAKALKKLDKDGDGKLSREEMRPPFPGRGPGGQGWPGGQGGPGQQGGPAERRPVEAGRQTTFEAAPRGKDDAETKVLAVLDEIRRSQGNQMNVPTTDGRMLRLLAEAVEAKNVVEIGTSNGISGIWFGLALRKTGGKLITHEIDPDTAALARKNFQAAGIGDLVTIVEGDAHQTVSKLKAPIDVIFLDADKQGYVDYLQKLLPLVRPGGLILAHNMTSRMADPAFVKEITTNPDLETLFYTPGGGLSVSLKKR